jgi:transposase
MMVKKGHRWQTGDGFEIITRKPTMINIRIRISTEMVKQMTQALHKAYKSGDAKMIRRILVLLDYSRGDSPDTIASRHGVGLSSVYAWLKQLLVSGLASLKPRWKGGRPGKLSKSQKKRLCELIKAGPQASGYPCGCWSGLLIQDLIWQAFGVLYNAHYVCDLLKSLGFSYQKARFVADHLDETKRLLWMKQTFPELKQQAQAAGASLLFGDEASFAQWGSLSYTWAPIGQQPVVPTSGKRKAYKVFGLIDFFSGRLFYQGIEGKFNSESYIAFLEAVLNQTSQPLFLVQDGARYHVSKLTRRFFQEQAGRLTVAQLPGYSPDYNPIEFLWRALKRRTTHNVYFPEFAALIASVEDALAFFQTRADYVKSLFTIYLDEMATATDESAMAV